MAEPLRFSLFSELMRRSVFKVAVVYVAAGYGVLQGVDLAVAPLHLPSWTRALLWVLVLASFPIAMVLAWAFELSRNGPTTGPSGRSGG